MRPRQLLCSLRLMAIFCNLFKNYWRLPMTSGAAIRENLMCAIIWLCSTSSYRLHYGRHGALLMLKVAFRLVGLFKVLLSFQCKLILTSYVQRLHWVWIGCFELRLRASVRPHGRNTRRVVALSKFLLLSVVKFGRVEFSDHLLEFIAYLVRFTFAACLITFSELGQHQTQIHICRRWNFFAWFSLYDFRTSMGWYLLTQIYL